MWRAQKVVEWGGEPRIQTMKPSTWLEPRHRVWINPRHDWTPELSVNFPRYWYSYAWRRVSWDEWSAAGSKYDDQATTHKRGKLRATRASAVSRWIAPAVGESAADLRPGEEYVA